MRHVTHLLSILAFVALVLASVIPQGWMPVAGSDGKVLLVLCTEQGVVEQWVDLDHDAPDHDDSDARMPCPMGSLAWDAID